MNNWEPVFSHGVCIGVGTKIGYDEIVGNYYQMICNSTLPETDEEYEEERNEIVRNMNLIAAAPMMLEKLKYMADTEIPSDLHACKGLLRALIDISKDTVSKVEPF